MTQLRDIPNVPTPTTALGFGCNNLLGDKTRDQGVRLLHAAYDAGIRHFDVARYYGYGDAEGIVAELTSNRRSAVTITTKFGMQPIKQLARFKSVVQLARKVMRSSSFVRAFVRRRISSVVQQGRFDVESARLNLEASLRELKTDYIDIYLLHECHAEDCRNELLDFLRSAQTQGKILTFGVGTEFSRARTICQSLPGFCTIAQFDSNVLTNHADQIRDDAIGIMITHGAFTPVAQIHPRLVADTTMTKIYSEDFGADLRDPTVLGGLILQHAMRANPKGIVLFRSARPQTIRDNVRAATERAYTDAQLDRFQAIAKELVRD